MRSASAVLALALAACGARSALHPPPEARDGGMDASAASDAARTIDAATESDAFALDAAPSIDAAPAPDAFAIDASRCGLVTSLPAQLLRAQSGTRTTTRRTDLHVDTTMWEQTPTVIAESSVWLSREAAGHLVLAGDASGGGAWYVDNFVLFEVFDCDERRVATALVGFTNGTVTRDGTVVAQLGANAFDFAGSAVSLDTLVPPGGAFRMDVTALDYGGWVSISDLFLVAR